MPCQSRVELNNCDSSSKFVFLKGKGERYRHLLIYSVLGSGKQKQGRQRPRSQEAHGLMGETREGRGLQEPGKELLSHPAITRGS